MLPKNSKNSIVISQLFNQQKSWIRREIDVNVNGNVTVDVYGSMQEPHRSSLDNKHRKQPLEDTFQNRCS